MEPPGPSIEAMQSTSPPKQYLKKSPKKTNMKIYSRPNNIPSPKIHPLNSPQNNFYPRNNFYKSSDDTVPFPPNSLQNGPPNSAPTITHQGNVTGSPRTQDSIVSSNRTVQSLKITVINDHNPTQRIVENAVQNASVTSPRTVQNAGFPPPMSVQNASIPPSRTMQNVVIPPPGSVQNTVIPSHNMTMQNANIPHSRPMQNQIIQPLMTVNTGIPPPRSVQNTVIPPPMSMQNSVIPPSRTMQNTIIPSPMTMHNTIITSSNAGMPSARMQNPVMSHPMAMHNSVIPHPMMQNAIRLHPMTMSSIPSPRIVQNANERPQFNVPRQVSFDPRNYPQRFPKNNSMFRPRLPGNQESVEDNGEPSNPRAGYKQRKYDYDEVDYNKKVIVSGFPAFTKPEEIIRHLSKLGTPYIEICKNRLAVVVFKSEQEATAAVKANDTIPIYGTILTISKYTSRRHVLESIRISKRVVKHEHKGPPVTAPTDIDLSGNFQQQVQNIENAIRLTQEEVDKINLLFEDIETYMKMIYPYCEAIPFGSITTGQGIKSSDADCFLALEPSTDGRPGAGAAELSGNFVNKAARLLRTYPTIFTQIVAIPKANTPIIKFLHVPTNVNCDLNSKTPLGVQNSRLLGHLLVADGAGRYSSAAVLLKYWARVHQLSGTGRLTNYALLLMLIFYLQQDHLPSVASLQGPEFRFMVENWDAGFNRGPTPITKVSLIKDILGGFFTYYASFNFDELVVSPLMGKPVRKCAFENDVLPPEMSLYQHNVRERLTLPLRTSRCLCIQDPFELSHNVASSVSCRLSSELKAFFTFGAEAYAAVEKNPGEFIRTILLSRPPSAECHLDSRLTTRVSLPGKLLQELDEDWREAVKDTLLNAFYKDMLILELKRKPFVSKEPEVEVEAYYCVATRPVWRRGRAERGQRTETGADTLRRLRHASQAIHCAKDLPDVHVPFEVEFGFREVPRGISIITTAMDGADLDAFRAFRQYSHNFIHRWFKPLLGPYLKLTPPAKPNQNGPRETPKRSPKKRNQMSPKKQQDKTAQNQKSSDKPPIETVSFVNSNHKDLSEAITAISLIDSSEKDSNRDNDST